jgi:pimeloyl-ACP methyl ester carboxylesterase
MPGHVIILHGYDSNGNAMARYETAIRGFMDPELLTGWRFWRPTYDWSRRFPEAADQVLAILEQARADGEDFTNTILVGYSMGGIVARSLVAKGFGCRNLLTISSPHMGAPLWTAGGFTPGVWSLSEWSQDLAELNDDAGDRRARRSYELYGVTYRNERGERFEDDGLFSYDSQVGAGMPGPSPFRERLEISFDTALTTPQAYAIHGMFVQDPSRVRDFLARVAHLILMYRGLKITWVEYDGRVPGSEADEYVEITNFDTDDRDLDGWSVSDHDEGTSFTFPGGSTIGAGQSVRIYTNEDHPEWGGYSFGSGRAIWNNAEADRAVLHDPQGLGVTSRVAHRALWGTKGS